MSNDIVNALRMRCDDDSCVMLCQTAADEIERLREERDRWAVMAERLYDIMLAHETVSDDDWNQGLHDCWLLMTGKE